MLFMEQSMKHKPKSMIVGTGMAVPEKILTNKDLEKIVDTSDEWIKTRTGMEIRHVVDNNTQTSDLSVEAAKKALAEQHIDPLDVDKIFVATLTPDIGFPSTACFVQEKLGAKNAAAQDIAAACSGFIYGLELADVLVASERAETVLVIGAETLTRITDYQDRTTCVLFGDGAGAAVVRPANGDRGILGTFTKSDGSLHRLLYMDGGGSKYPASYETVDKRLHFIKMEGREVFKYAVTTMGDAAEIILKQSGLTSDDVGLLIPHQANRRILDATARRLKIPPERVMINVHKYGNTSAASIPIAIDEARKEGRLREGQIAVLVAFGAGFTWGSAAIRF
jgi:3-oxoacyl-[acyl-carrier-protein] synthase-3